LEGNFKRLRLKDVEHQHAQLPSTFHCKNNSAAMSPTTSFGPGNTGFQAGTINGSVQAEIHHHHRGELERVQAYWR
jgi:hypothetical protein